MQLRISDVIVREIFVRKLSLPSLLALGLVITFLGLLIHMQSVIADSDLSPVIW
jgi:uncharacterized membrane protein (DUF373 family)